MTLHYEDAGLRLFHGSNRDVLPSLPDALYDSIVTDPPYGVQQGANQKVCGRRHRIVEPNVLKQQSRRRCRACALERARARSDGRSFDRDAADQTYREIMGEI